MKIGKYRVLIGAFVVVMGCGGCATLAQLPLQLLKLPFDILGWTFELLKKIPMPPPGVF